MVGIRTIKMHANSVWGQTDDENAFPVIGKVDLLLLTFVIAAGVIGLVGRRIRCIAACGGGA